MPEKSPKRLKLEASLADDPADPFLRYGLALQCLRDGDVEEGRSLLRALIADRPDQEVAPYQQLGQSYLDTEEYELARAILSEGIAQAKRIGDRHAEAEMEGLISQCD